MEQLLTDFPKLECPFVRRTFKVDSEHYQKYGREYQLRAPEVYLAVDEINPGYEWVFEDEDTIAVEKLNGTNVKVLTEKGRIITVQNRKNVVDPLLMKGIAPSVMEGICRAVHLGLLKPDGEQAGELIGIKLQGNPYQIDGHLWYPFDVAIERLKYNSFQKHPRTFDNLSEWSRQWLFSRFCEKRAAKQDAGDTALADKIFAEGVVFYNLRRRAEKKTWRAKLRRDMFAWYYEKIAIQGYDRSRFQDTREQE